VGGHATARRYARWEYEAETSAASLRSAARIEARQRSTDTVRRKRPAAYADTPLPRPRVVPHPIPRARVTACLRVAGLIILAGLMVAVSVSINAAAVRAEVELAQLEQHEADLIAERSALQARVAALSSHERVEQLAADIGMVDSVPFEFLDVGAGSGSSVTAALSEGGTPRRR
jgi:cell division protein FtsL